MCYKYSTMTNSKELFKLLTVVVILCDGTAYKITSKMLQEFEDYVETVMECRKVPSLAITLVKENNVIYSKGFGYANVEEKIPATNKTKFSIGSLTKAFTSTILAKMLSQHTRYTWDTPVRHILGNGFKLVNKLLTENVNLRDLLAHKVGVPGYFNALLVGFPENLTREQFVSYLEYLPTYYPFRTEFVYSNFMYTLAGYVSEVLGGKSWENLVREQLFAPLGMESSGFVTEVNNFDKQFALSYAHRNGKPIRINEQLLQCVDPLGPAGSIYSTANDMGKWILFHLQAIKNISKTPLSSINQDIISETYNSQMATPFSGKNLFRPKYPIDDVSLSYALGWVTSVYRGYKRVWHSGGIVGFSSLQWLFPHKDVGMFVSLTGSQDNDNQLPIRVIMSRAADMLLGETPWLDPTTACSFPAPWSNSKKPLPYNGRDHFQTFWNISRPMSHYVGSYGHSAFGNISVFIENNTELILYYGRFGRLALTPVTKTLFQGRYIGPLWFATQSDGQRQRAVNINFSLPVNGSASNLSYPVDNEFPITFLRDFKQEQQQQIQSSLHFTCTSGSLKMSQAFLLVFGSALLLIIIL